MTTHHSPEGTSMRDALRPHFEAWAKKEGYSTEYTVNAECGVEGGPVYKDSRTHAAWWSFRAGHALATPVPALPAGLEPVGDVVRYKEHEMYAMQREGTLPRVPAWLVYCDGEPNVPPQLHGHFRFSMFHTPVWIPLVHQRLDVPPSPTVQPEGPKAQAQAAEPHFMSLEAVQQRATQKEFGRIERMVGAIKAAQQDAYSDEDKRFHAWWYSHMVNDQMQPPFAQVSHSTARAIWDAATFNSHLLAEDIEAFHLAMDKRGVPRQEGGQDLSMYGRACALASPVPALPAGQEMTDERIIQMVECAGIPVEDPEQAFALVQLGYQEGLRLAASPTVQPEVPLSLGEIALEECLQLGYTVDGDRLNPPDNNEWRALVASRLAAEGFLRG